MASIQVAPASEVPEGTGKTFTINGQKIAIFQANGTFYAMDDTCSHAEASLGAGEVDPDEETVECPLHGSMFGLASGKPRTLPAYEPVATYPVKVEDGMLIVEYSG
jgi:3-phenylpropionate/trans-cinnamate dioxygenase ferredoxin subunit